VANIYDKIDSALKEIRRTQDLIKQGLAKPSESEEARRFVKETAGLLTDDIFKRKVEKLSRVTVWINKTKDGFASTSEAAILDPWITLLEEYKDARKIKAEISSDTMHVKSIIDGEDQHILITEKGSGEHAHLILDGGTGEIRIDPKDKPPHELIKSVEAKLKLKTGEVVQITQSGLSFEAPQADVRAYMATKDGYTVLAVYNSGTEDLEDFYLQANWLQPEGPQQVRLEKFNDVTDYLVMAMPRSLNVLKSGTEIYAINIPSISVDKKIKITISCKGIRSGTLVKNVFVLETPNQY
jgi:hypothetical protein